MFDSYLNCVLFATVLYVITLVFVERAWLRLHFKAMLELYKLVLKNDIAARWAFVIIVIGGLLLQGWMIQLMGWWYASVSILSAVFTVCSSIMTRKILREAEYIPPVNAMGEEEGMEGSGNEAHIK